MKKKIHLQYFTYLREARGLSEETLQTDAKTARDLYQRLKTQHRFKLTTEVLRVAINAEFQDWSTPLQEGDRVVFIPPVAGG